MYTIVFSYKNRVVQRQDFWLQHYVICFISLSVNLMQCQCYQEDLVYYHPMHDTSTHSLSREL